MRKKSVDTVSDVVKEGMRRGRPWHALQAMGFAFLGEGPNAASYSNTSGTATGGVDPKYLRETAYLVFAGCPNLVLDLQTEAVVGVFRRGLEDACVEVSAFFRLFLFNYVSLIRSRLDAFCLPRRMSPSGRAVKNGVCWSFDCLSQFLSSQICQRFFFCFSVHSLDSSPMVFVSYLHR